MIQSNSNKHFESYFLLNKIFAGIILAIFLYSICYNPDSNAYPIPCIHEQIIGTSCATCGMSHAFSALVRLQFDKANTLQPKALPIFLFFFIQILLRIAAIVIQKKTEIPIKLVVYSDIVVSITLFLLTFHTLIHSVFLTLSHLHSYN